MSLPPALLQTWNSFSRTLMPLLAIVIAMLGVGASTAGAGTLGNALFHHGFHVDEPGTDALGDKLSGEMGADTIRMHVYWEQYQTGPETYSTEWLQGIVSRVKTARETSGDGSIKALLIFELPTSKLEWMTSAGYGLQNTKEVAPGAARGVARYYPTTQKGLEAYGLAMAKALKYLNEAGIAEYMETPNEPNLIGGPSEVVPAAKVGQLGGMAVSKAYKLGIPQKSSSGGPAILIGSIASTTENDYEFGTSTEYFGTVQYYTDITLEQQFYGEPFGAEIAGGLQQQWRPSFHAYPKSGPVESSYCAHVSGEKTQDQGGDITATAALATVTSKLTPLVNAIANGNHWWLTETGMSSFKSDKLNSESESECVTRREVGGSTYGKIQQSEFVSNFISIANSQISSGSGIWSRMEGATFFKAQDEHVGQFAGFGFYCVSLKCGSFETSYRSPKPAATTFLQRAGSPVWHIDNLGEKGATSDPDVSSWGLYRLDFFVRGAKSELRHRAYNGAGWTEWGTIPGGPELTSGPGAVSWGPNRIDVVARVSDGSIGHWATPDGGTNWYYDNLGEKASSSDPDVSSWGEGRLDFFVKGPKNELRHEYYNGTWSSWETIPGGPELASAPAAVSWGANRIDVAARLADGTVGHWATSNGGASWAYDNIGGSIVSAPDISSRGYGTLHFFGRNSENKLVTKTYAGGWSGWETIPVGSLISGPGAASWNSERTDVAGRASDSSIVHWAGSP